MGHWRRLIKIPGGTDCYYCINHMRCSTHVYYCPFILVTIPDVLFTIMSHVYLVTRFYICHTLCGNTLFMDTYTLHCLYSALCIPCRHHLSRPASQNTLEPRRDMSRRRIYARKIPHVYALSLKLPETSYKSQL